MRESHRLTAPLEVGETRLSTPLLGGVAMARGTRVVALLGLAGGLATAMASAHSSSAAEHRDPRQQAQSVLQPIDVDEPEPLTEVELLHILELRREYGLNTDRQYVSDLYEAPAELGAQRSARWIAGAILYTDEEAIAINERAAAEWAAAEVDSWATEAEPDSYAGTFIDERTVVVLCARCDPETLAAGIGDEVDAVRESEFVVRQAERSIKELSALADVYAEALAARTADYNYELDVEINEYVFHVSALELGLAPPPPGITVREDFVPATLTVYKDHDWGYNLVMAGQAISNDFDGGTSAFAVSSGYGPFILAAGHVASDGAACNRPGAVWRQGGRTLGVTGFCQYGGALDVAGISTAGYRNAIGRVHYKFSDDYHEITFGVSTHALKDQTVCQTGKATTGLTGNLNPSGRCGVVSSLAHNPNLVRASPPTTASFGRATYISSGGDSGAAVVWPTGYGFGAAGVQSASGAQSSFSRYNVIANTFGLTLIPY